MSANEMNAEDRTNHETDGRRRFSLIRGGGSTGGNGSTGDIERDGTDVEDAHDIAEADGSIGADVEEGHPGAPTPESDQSQDDGSDSAHSGEKSLPTVAEMATHEGQESVDEADPEGREAIARQALALLSDADPITYYRSLKGLVRESHSSVLGPLDYDPDLSFHDPAQVVVQPAPTTVDTALLYARAAYPDFDEVVLAPFVDPSRSDLLVALYDLLVIEQRNIALVTNHGQIIDIALVVAALFVAMVDDERRFGVLDDSLSVDEMADRCNSLISRMVGTRQAFGIPALQVLQSVTRTFLSVPQTASRRRAKLDASLVKANNALMRFELENRLEVGGQIVAMAASGTQDLTIPQLLGRARSAWRIRRGDDPGEVPTLHLQPLYNGTISLIRSCDYVLPVAVSLEHKCPAVVVGSLTRVRTDDDCHAVMDWIALAHQEATGIPTIYHPPGDDLLTQVKGLISR